MSRPLTSAVLPECVSSDAFGFEWFAQVRCWVVVIVLCGLVGSSISCGVGCVGCNVVASVGAADAEQYVTTDCLVLSSLSSFAWCQIACNLARAGLIWSVLL